MSRPQLVIFDCDGVLVDSEPVANRILGQMLRELGLDLTQEQVFENFVGYSLPHCLRVIEGMLGRPPPENFLRDLQARTFAAFKTELRAMPGIQQVLEALDAARVPFCVASSGDHAKMNTTLGLTGLLPRFAGRIFSVTQVARGKPAPDVYLLAARQLGVQQVVCGELRAAADGWSVALAVVDGVSGTRRWSHRFALARAELPDQIAQIAAQAARALLVEMHRTAAAAAAELPVSQRSAGDLALQGWTSVYDGLSPGNLERAQRFFEQAVDKDPSHLRGLGGLCMSNYWQAQLGWASDCAQAYWQAVDTAARLEKLYPDETLTALARGSAADIEQRWDLRLSIYDRLCERDPANPTAHFARGAGLLRLGRFDECLTEFGEARRLSVDDFRAGWWCSFAACAHLMAGRHAQAAIEAQQAIAANACLPLPPLLLAAALAGDGRSAEGREVLRQHMLREPQCDRTHAEMLLGHGDAGYAQGCTRILSTLDALGIAGG